MQRNVAKSSQQLGPMFPHSIWDEVNFTQQRPMAPPMMAVKIMPMLNAMQTWRTENGLAHSGWGMNFGKSVVSQFRTVEESGLADSGAMTCSISEESCRQMDVVAPGPAPGTGTNPLPAHPPCYVRTTLQPREVYLRAQRG